MRSCRGGGAGGGSTAALNSGRGFSSRRNSPTKSPKGAAVSRPPRSDDGSTCPRRRARNPRPRLGDPPPRPPPRSFRAPCPPASPLAATGPGGGRSLGPFADQAVRVRMRVCCVRAHERVWAWRGEGGWGRDQAGGAGVEHAAHDAVLLAHPVRKPQQLRRLLRCPPHLPRRPRLSEDAAPRRPRHSEESRAAPGAKVHEVVAEDPRSRR